jgi:hypothetical protein
MNLGRWSRSNLTYLCIQDEELRALYGEAL